MRIKKRFYCQDCNVLEDRRLVQYIADEYGNEAYYCRLCGSKVMRFDKVMSAMFFDFCHYLIEKGEEDQYK